MKIFMLVSRIPWPLEKGDKLRAYHQVKELSRNHEIILASVSDQVVLPEHLDALKPFCKKIIVHQLSYFKVLRNLVVSLFSTLPFQVRYFYSKKFPLMVREKERQFFFSGYVSLLFGRRK